MTLKLSDESFFDGVRLRDKIIGWTILIGPLIGLFVAATIFLKSEPIDNQLVLGCYVADGFPPLDIQPKIIRIGQPDRRSFTYKAEPAKQGYRLAVSPALALALDDGGHQVFVPQKGAGSFWRLLSVSGDGPLRHPDQYGGRFQL